MTSDQPCPLLPDPQDRLDAVADVLAGVAEPDVAEHVAGCAVCAPLLADLQAALPGVATALAAAPAPPGPTWLQDRLSAALAAEAAVAPGVEVPTTATVLPMRPARQRSWLPWAGGVAAAAALVTGGVLLAGNGPAPSTSTATSASRAAPRLPSLVRNDSGTDYGRDGRALVAAVPQLLAGTALAPSATDLTTSAGAAAGGGSAVPVSPEVSGPAPALDKARRSPLAATVPLDALARLRTDEGLASCLASLTSPDVPGDPLALDYASFAGQPALVVLLPSARPGKVDVFVLGAGCSQADAKVLYFTRAGR